MKNIYQVQKYYQKSDQNLPSKPNQQILTHLGRYLNTWCNFENFGILLIHKPFMRDIVMHQHFAKKILKFMVNIIKLQKNHQYFWKQTGWKCIGFLQIYFLKDVLKFSMISHIFRSCERPP